MYCKFFMGEQRNVEVFSKNTVFKLAPTEEVIPFFVGCSNLAFEA